MGPKRLDPWVVAAVVVGVALRFINLGSAPFWFDEDNQAPISYGILNAWSWISDPGGEVQHALLARYPTCPGIEVPGIRILCLRPRAATAVANPRP